MPDGTPILVDEAMRPVEPWCTFLRLYRVDLSSNSIAAYARDALEFARFLESRGIGVLDVTEQDIVGYRAARLEAGISGRSWARQLVVIRALFTYLYETGQRHSLPWIQVGIALGGQSSPTESRYGCPSDLAFTVDCSAGRRFQVTARRRIGRVVLRRCAA